MAHEITLQQAAESADQGGVVLLMLSKTIEDMDSGDIEAAVILASRLVARAAAWLLEEQYQQEGVK